MKLCQISFEWGTNQTCVVVSCAGSAVFYYDDAQKAAAEKSRNWFNSLLKAAGRNAIVTEISPAPEYFFAEEYRKLSHSLQTNSSADHERSTIPSQEPSRILRAWRDWSL